MSLASKTVWFTTINGGQLGIHRDNILFVGSEFVVTKNKFRWMLDPTKWAEHRLAFTRSCLA